MGRSLKGDLLRFADPAWVQTLASGMNWIVIGAVFGFIIGMIGGGVIWAKALPLLYVQLLTFALSTIGLVGYWKITTPDPSGMGEHSGLNARVLARFVQVGGFAVGGCKMGLERFQPETAQVLGAVLAISGIVGTIAIFVLGRQIALRIPDSKLARHCRIVMWGLAAAGVLSLLLIVFVMVGMVGLKMVAAMPTTMMTSRGNVAVATSMSGKISPMTGVAMGTFGCLVTPLAVVFGIWALLLVIRFRRALNEAARMALATWAAPSGPGSIGI